MILELQKVVQALDGLLGNYPVFVFLENAAGEMVWCNHYTGDCWPELAALQTEQGVPEKFLTIERVIIADTGDNKPGLVKKFQARRSMEVPGEDRIVEFLSIPIIANDGQVDGNVSIGVDVTDGEKGRRLLREKQKLLATIIESSTDAIIVTDTEDHIISWNSGAQTLFGYQANEILNQPVERLIPEEMRDSGELTHFHQLLAEQNSIQNFESKRLRKDGSTCYVDISAVNLFDENQQPQGISQIIKSIDSRKKLELELLRTIMELSKLNELNDILYTTYDEEEILTIILVAITAGEGLRFNRAFLLMISEDGTELGGKLAIGPADQEDASRIWKELDSESGELSDIVRSYHIDLKGTDRKVNEIVQRIRVSLQDEDQILARSLNERRLFEVEERAVFGGGHCSFRVGETDLFDILQHDTFVVAPMYTKKEPLGVLIADNGINHRRIASEDVESVKIFAHRASLAIENARLYQHLEERIEELQVANRRIAEKQEKLLQAERLAAIGEMSAKIAHEIRNPLVSIGGFARLIERKIEGESELKKYAGIISEQVLHLESILSNILAVARQANPSEIPVDINEVLQRVFRMMKPAMDSRGIQYQLDAPRQTIHVRGDEKQLYQAFMNLVKNAIEALENRATPARITVAIKPVDQAVKIDIADNGPGIEQSLISKIFQSFFTTKSGGTGLGLAIVRQIVEGHDGTVIVNSKPGEGASFSITLPTVVENIQAQENIDQTHAQQAN